MRILAATLAGVWLVSRAEPQSPPARQAPSSGTKRKRQRPSPSKSTSRPPAPSTAPPADADAAAESPSPLWPPPASSLSTYLDDCAAAFGRAECKYSEKQRTQVSREAGPSNVPFLTRPPLPTSTTSTNRCKPRTTREPASHWRDSTTKRSRFFRRGGRRPCATAFIGKRSSPEATLS